MDERAVRLVVSDDLQRSRLTVFFRFFLALPHLLWLFTWFSIAVPTAIANWIAAVISGEPSPTLHRFLSAYARYVTHVVAYMSLAANPYPGFMGNAGGYPIDLEIDAPRRQNRWVTGFRLFLAVPAILLADTLLGFGTSFAGGIGTYGGGAVATVAFLAWFACLARGRMPQGFRDLLAYAIGYSAQVNAYLLLLTDRYPNSDPALSPWATRARSDPIQLEMNSDELRRSRLLVFFRLPLAMIHFIWLTLWTVPALLAVVASWFATLVSGRTPGALHRFLAAYLRYQTHVYAFVGLVGNPFPGFVGRRGGYPVDLDIQGPRRQNRWVTAFRIVLAFPALLVAGALSSAAYVAAFLGWFAALFTGRMPMGLRNLGAFSLRYAGQTYGYLALLTDRYPYSGPLAGWQLSLTSPVFEGT